MKDRIVSSVSVKREQQRMITKDDIILLVNGLVAFGTILLAIMTYLLARSSEKQRGYFVKERKRVVVAETIKTLVYPLYVAANDVMASLAQLNFGWLLIDGDKYIPKFTEIGRGFLQPVNPHAQYRLARFSEEWPGLLEKIRLLDEN